MVIAVHIMDGGESTEPLTKKTYATTHTYSGGSYSNAYQPMTKKDYEDALTFFHNIDLVVGDTIGMKHWPNVVATITEFIPYQDANVYLDQQMAYNNMPMLQRVHCIRVRRPAYAGSTGMVSCSICFAEIDMGRTQALKALKKSVESETNDGEIKHEC